MKDKTPPPSRKNPPSSAPPAPPQPPGTIESGKTQEMSRAEILEYLEKLKRDGAL
jgi:hypothetical protein